MQEDDIKKIINDKLISRGWTTKVAWGRKHGVDIEATKDEQKVFIEVKGPGSRPAMRNNYFLSILGEILQRMDDESGRYFIALPDMEVYRKLWDNLPKLAKKRTTIKLLLVNDKGEITVL